MVGYNTNCSGCNDGCSYMPNNKGNDGSAYMRATHNNDFQPGYKAIDQSIAEDGANVQLSYMDQQQDDSNASASFQVNYMNKEK